MNGRQVSGRAGTLMLLSGLAALGSTAHAQQVRSEQNVLLLEELVVTARAREEELQDVPISIATVSGRTLDEAGIINLEQLAIPNFTVTQEPLGDKIGIRGIFTSAIASLEQSVSTFVDGLNRGRGTQSKFTFLDLERVEVLRGPQGTLFGKNTVGGALNLTTRKPTGVFALNLNAGYETELEEASVAGVVNVPFSESVRSRVAFAASDQDEGFIDNRFDGDTSPRNQNGVVRGILDVDLSERSLLRTSVEYRNFDTKSQPFALRTAGVLAAPLQQLFGVPDGSLSVTAIGQAPGSPLNFGSSGTLRGDAQEASLTYARGFASGGSLEVIGAYSGLDFKRRFDADFSFLDLLGFEETEDYAQTSLSIRLLSREDARVRYVSGLYYQHVDLELAGLTALNTTTAQQLTGGACNAAGLNALDALQLFNSAVGRNGQTPANAIAQLRRAGNAAAVNDCTAFGATLAFPTPLGRIAFLDQQGDAFAVYGQADADLTDRLLLTLGLRYTLETKEARQGLFATSFGSRQPNPALADPLFFLLEAQAHQFTEDQLDREENKVNYSSSLRYRFTDSINGYVSISSGFKAGGFNVASFSAVPADAEFEEEEVTAYEVGLKTTLFGGRAQLNAAYFFTEIEDLQVGQFTGDSSLIVQNAAEARTQGVELDARLRVTKDLGFSAALSYTDFEFTSFPRAGCTVQQLLALRQGAFDQGAALLADGNRDNDAMAAAIQLLGSNQTQRECSGLGVNNLRGRTAEQVPRYKAQLGADYHLEFANGIAIDALAGVDFSDRQFRNTDLDPVTESGSFAKTNLSFSFYRLGDPWRVSIIGRNIFDRRTFSNVDDAPLLDTTRQQSVDQPRTVRIQLEYDFQ